MKFSRLGEVTLTAIGAVTIADSARVSDRDRTPPAYVPDLTGVDAVAGRVSA
ncbi:MAG TPA: hypothetical protein VF016_01570 [Nitrososphaera sp.]